ncbi:hypothetical protein K2173_017901 [Erythroxylum novogranatense]|uniref:GTD-binding domain-containing protein n=1 Tax=Erythroxylum novogranatense TaxID=1862640 RepID=A0AAV8TW89_9ROSI|nr:hypothetical protein K2173_017901 [Erythroxylum novogranatense]
MAAETIPSVKSYKRTDSIITTLGSVALEWLLIFMLLTNAIFSYLITKFACQYELQTPCLLCSRLDRIFGNKKLKNFWDLLCRSHKLEISSLVLCHAHNKLVNVQGMCDNCLFLFATINNSNAKTYRLLVGKLGEDSACDSGWDPLVEVSTLGTIYCTCCDESLVPRHSGQKLLQTISFSSRAVDLDVLYSDAFGHDHDNLEKSSQSLSHRTTHLSCGLDPLHHVAYTELKMHSDMESEAQFSDHDGSIVENNLKEDVEVEYLQREHRIFTLPDGLSSEKLIDSVFAPDLSTSVSESHTHVLESKGVTFEWHKVNEEHVLREINWQPAGCKTECHTIHEDKKIDDISASTVTKESCIEASNHNIPICLGDIPPSSNSGETLAEDSVEGFSRNEKTWQPCVTDSDGICNMGNVPATSTKADSEVNPVPGDSVEVPNLLDLSDAYKLAVGNKGRQLSGLLAEQWNDKESLRIGEGLKLLISQLSAAREHSINDASPRPSMSPNISLNSSELKIYDATISMGMNVHQQRISLDRNESGLSLDGSIVSEIEGESMTDRLRRQVDHDKILLGVLYKELEEERNASAIAANQALAMITRLQEERATLHMEALQCIRMMEEQAEYDEEALAKANDLLSQRDKELQDLEAEIEFYRNKFQDDSVLEGTMMPASNVITSDIGPAEITRIMYIEQISEKSDVLHKVEGPNALFGDKIMGTGDNFSIVFEDEKLYILRNLKKLEMKLYLFSTSGLQKDLTNGQYSRNEDRLKQPNSKLSMDPSKANKSGRGHSPDELESSCKENIEISCGAQSFSLSHAGAWLDSLSNEVADLNERLGTLEADRSFLQQTINSMRSGEEGLRLIQEVASSLKELRMMGIRRREQKVA